MAKVEATPKEEGAAAKPRFETLRAVFWAALIALAIRSFVVEPFKIPSGSMIPTLLIGDYVLVNKFTYGIRLPITGTLLFGEHAPARGDVIVFRWPDGPSQDYIKRVVGMPGDRIQILDRRLWINGQIVDRVPDGEYALTAEQVGGGRIDNRFLERNPEGVEYSVLQAKGSEPGEADRRGPWIVPDGHYFMMGDNRDNSADSRMWRNPFVSPEQIKGKAFMIHWSWLVASAEQAPRSFIGDLFFTVWRVVTFQVEEIRWGRIGRSVGGRAD